MAIWATAGFNVNLDITPMRPQLEAIKAAGWKVFSSEGVSQKQVSILREYLPYINYGGENGEDVYASGSMYYRPRTMADGNYNECYHKGINYLAALKSANQSTPNNMGLTLMMYTTADLEMDTAAMIAAIQNYIGNGVRIATILFWAGVNDCPVHGLDSTFNPLYKALDAKFKFVVDGSGAPTASTITASAASVVINGPVIFNTQLKDGKSMAVLANKPITIYHTFNGVRYDDITINTDANGATKLTQQFASPGVRMYYAEFKGDSTYAASTSPLLSITVTSTPPTPVAQTVMTLTAMDTHPLVNVPDIFTATLTTADGKPVAGKNIVVKHTYCGGTYTDATLTTNANGQATITQKFTSHCLRAYTATFIGDTGYSASGAKVDIYATQPP